MQRAPHSVKVSVDVSVIVVAAEQWSHRPLPGADFLTGSDQGSQQFPQGHQGPESLAKPAPPQAMG